MSELAETAVYPNAPELDIQEWNANRSLLGDWIAAQTGYFAEGRSLAYHTNCYEFAVNANNFKDRGGDNPGDVAGVSIDDLIENKGLSYESAIIHGATVDGLTPFIEDGLPPHKEGYYPVALFIKDKGNDQQDFHWLRANQDGTWSETPGHGAIKLSRDWKGDPITEPHSALRGAEIMSSYEFSMYFYVPEEGIKTGLSTNLENTFNENGMDGLHQRLSEIYNSEADIQSVAKHIVCETTQGAHDICQPSEKEFELATLAVPKV